MRLTLARHAAPLFRSSVQEKAVSFLGSFTGAAPAPVSAQIQSAGGPILAAKGVEKRFVVQGRTTTVFDAFDFAVEEGSFVSIVGPSGCGKSTLLKLMAGLDSATGGEVLFKGNRVQQPPKGVIYVFQQYTKSIFPWRTVLENVAFGLEHRRGLSAYAAQERCAEFIRLVGLEGYEDYYPSQLSGGMQQRVAIARALVCKPDVLMMDEPFSAVDALTRATLQQLVLKIWQSIPLTVVFVTHDVDEAVYLSSRVVSLSRAPARVADDVPITLPYPRDQVKTRSDARYITARERLLSRILAAEDPSLVEGHASKDRVEKRA
jgi:NitT/TauT family transport system ATP-binding protein